MDSHINGFTIFHSNMYTCTGKKANTTSKNNSLLLSWQQLYNTTVYMQFYAHSVTNHNSVWYVVSVRS